MTLAPFRIPGGIALLTLLFIALVFSSAGHGSSGGPGRQIEDTAQLTEGTLPEDDVQEQEDRDREQRRDRNGDLISIFSGDIEVPAGTNRRGMVFSLGGGVEIDGTIGEVVVIGGTLRITGDVGGQVLGIFTDMELDGAEIDGQLVNILGGLQETDSYIDGPRVNITPFGSWFPGVGLMLFWSRMFMLFCGFIMLLLLAALVPERIRVMGEEAPVRYVPAFFVGILGYLGLLVLFSLLAVTVIGIPLALVAVFVMRWLGTAGLFYAVGRRVGRGVGAEMSVFGAVLLTFTLYGLLKLAPTPLGLVGVVISCVLWTLFLLLIDIPAIGLVILTRMGTRTQAGLVGAAPGHVSAELTVPPTAPAGDPSPPPPPQTP